MAWPRIWSQTRAFDQRQRASPHRRSRYIYCSLSILLVFFFLGRDYTCHRLTSHSLNNSLWTDDLERYVDLQGRSVAIVITVHGAIDYLRLCLDSIHRHSTGVHVYLSDDSPLPIDREKVLYLSRIYSNTTYLTQPGVPVGYTKTVNLGLQTAATAGFPTIIQLNSDTEVTPGWLPPIVATLNEDRTIGAVGTLSNAASWQSVPELNSKAGGWSTNELKPGWTPDMMAKLVRLVSRNKPIELPILNGFLIAYKKEVFSRVGYMDAELSPRGFGEENDFAFRCRDQGYRLVVEPSVYVHHHKAKSYDLAERAVLTKSTSEALKKKYSHALDDAVKLLANNTDLAEIRKKVANHLPSSRQAMASTLSVLILTGMGQQDNMPIFSEALSQALQMHYNGMFVRVAVPEDNLLVVLKAFPTAKAAGIIFPVDLDEEVISSGVFDVVIATHATMLDTVIGIVDAYPRMIPGYHALDMNLTSMMDSTNPAMENIKYLQSKEAIILNIDSDLEEAIISKFTT